MRVADRGIERVGRPVELTFEGRRIEGLEGESLAAALTAAGIRGLRRTSHGDRRGVFCGMGVCQECLVAVDGRGARRACMTPVTDGLAAAPQPHFAAAGETGAPMSFEHLESAPDVLIVGGGPAGLAAAHAAATQGAAVTLVDERPALGGQYFKQLAKSHRFRAGRITDRQFRRGRRLIDEVLALPVTIVQGAVWGAFAADEIGVVAEAQSHLFRPKRLILATGAYERAVPMPGWTLPGFMTTGGCQTLLRAYRVAPGRRILLAGNGPLNLQVAAELLRGGIEVVAVAELAAGAGLGRLGPALRAVCAAPELIRDGMRDLLLLKRAGVPILYRHLLVRAEGEGQVAAAVVAQADQGRPIVGSERRFTVDAVCVGYGFLPQNELARALGCRHRVDPRFDQLAVERDDDGRTSVSAVFVAGDAGGLGGAQVALCQGAIAGHAAAADVGRPPDDAALAGWRRRLARHLRFQAALWQLYRAPVLCDQLAEADTLICRCEAVDRASLEAALAAGCTSLGALKRHTRAGMGRCQGRYCGPIMAHMIARASGRPLDEFDLFAPRAPTRPVPIAAIAGVDS